MEPLFIVHLKSLFTVQAGDTEWARQMHSISSAIKDGEAAVRDLQKWVWHNVVGYDTLPRELPTDVAHHLGKIDRALDTACSGAATLLDRLCAGPLHKLLCGYRMTREDYYLLTAQGVLKPSRHACMSEYDDYEIFDMFFCEDPEHDCYIDPATIASNPAGRDWGRVRPQEIPISRLRPEQRLFFETHFPDVAARFKRET